MSDRLWVVQIDFVRVMRRATRPLDPQVRQMHRVTNGWMGRVEPAAAFKTYERRKHADAARCRIEVRAGKRQYEQFHDQEVAEETIAFILGTDAALSNREAMIERLTELSKLTLSGRLDASGIYDSTVFREAAVVYIDRLTTRLGQDSSYG